MGGASPTAARLLFTRRRCFRPHRGGTGRMPPRQGRGCRRGSLGTSSRAVAVPPPRVVDPKWIVAPLSPSPSLLGAELFSFFLCHRQANSIRWIVSPRKIRHPLSQRADVTHLPKHRQSQMDFVPTLVYLLQRLRIPKRSYILKGQRSLAHHFMDPSHTDIRK